MGDSPVILALDFGGTKTAVAVCDLAGTPLATVTSSHSPAAGDGAAARRGGREIFAAGVQAARDLLDRHAPGRELAAVGAATFGIPFEDRVLLAPAIDGWEALAFGRELRAAFSPAPVQIATDAKAAAAAEARWGSLHGCDPGVYLNLGTGLSAALVIGGRVVAGRDGAAGEIGYCLRGISDVGLALTERVPLEDAVSGQGLARQAAGLTAAGVFQAARQDPGLSALVAAVVDELAFHLVNLAICLNPVRIAAGGGLVRSWDRLGPPLARALAAGTPFPPELVVARFPYDAPLRGAAALAADAAAALPTRLGTPAQPDNLTEGRTT